MNSALVLGSVPNLLNKNKSQGKAMDDLVDGILDGSNHELIQESSETQTDSKWAKKSSLTLEDDEDEPELLENQDEDQAKTNNKKQGKSIINLVQSSLKEANTAETQSLNTENSNNEELEEDSDMEEYGDKSTNLIDQTDKLANEALRDTSEDKEANQQELLQIQNQSKDDMQDDEISTDTALNQAGENEEEGVKIKKTSLLETANNIVSSSDKDEQEAVLLEEEEQKSGDSEQDEVEFTETKAKKENVGEKAIDVLNMIETDNNSAMESEAKEEEKSASKDSSEYDMEEYIGESDKQN